MKAISIEQPYATIISVSGEMDIPFVEDTDHRGKLLVCAGNENVVPAFEGIITQQAICVVELAKVRPLTPEELEQIGSSEKRFAWTLRNPRIVVPFKVESQKGLFEVFADIEYISSEAQFTQAYGNWLSTDMSVDLFNLYTLVSDSYFNDTQNKQGDLFRPY